MAAANHPGVLFRKSSSYLNVEELMKASVNEEPTPAKLTLEDGTVINGFSFGAEKSVAGEVVFNTGMVGYPESLTDPSYRGQILVTTYPLIGNYGVPSDEKDKYGLAKYFESDNIQVSALIVSDYSFDHSHHLANKSLSEWLQEHNIPALYGVDTRELTKKIRTKGSMLAKVEFGADKIDFEDPNTRNLVAEVSRSDIVTYGDPGCGKKILAVDCGIKNNIIRYLRSKGVYLKVVPWDFDFTNEEFDGLFLSNGPGNPMKCQITIDHIKTVMANRPDTPIFGVCMGHQLLSLAAGCTTYKMKFGNRGMNQPCIDLRNLRCYITPQNHGFAVDEKSMPDDWVPFFRNANDHSNEGIIHRWRSWFSVQFHPEAQGGPTDTEFLFDMFLRRVADGRSFVTTLDPPAVEVVDKVLILGSGGLTIGQAGEFDYSGSQAIKALKEHNMKVILINPNIATVQTSKGMADEVYFLPVTPKFVEGVIEKERPDGILLQFGGQTALNCGIALRNSGVLEKYNVRVLGTPVDTIMATEDREVFAQKLAEINEKVAPSLCATNVDEGLSAAEKLGYPVLVRAAFALGGLGSGFADNPVEMRELCAKAFAKSTQIIIDKSLRGWKEVEYEVVRDISDNCITVCNMENFDPLGIHTGDSIVIAPSQTLTNREYYMLRSTAIKIIRHLGVIGECNIQYALDPFSEDFCVIEVNARLSRSSALASKATGYPLAYVAAKLALGIPLTSIKNSITKKTCACFEPAMDYVVVKFPRWDMRKFSRVEKTIGSQMKSVGEVMAIDRNFEAAMSKALRMVDDSVDGFGFVPEKYKKMNEKELQRRLSNPGDRRIFALTEALHRNYSVEQIHELTKIDYWFLCKLRNIIVMERTLGSGISLDCIPRSVMLHAKKLGLSDKQIARILNSKELDVRRTRKDMNVIPYVKQIDTLAAEFPAETNYLYVTYCGDAHDLDFNDHGIMVLGCGAYRIGSSCEFDWCAVSATRTLRECGQKSIVVNYNPETVSTDYDECDRLYFEELSFERVLDIYELEMSCGVIVSVGGQIPNNLAMPLHSQGVRILGTQPGSIDNAEDRFRFSKLLDTLHINQPRWRELTTMSDALRFATEVGFPVLVRPSYVLSGAAMNVAQSEEELVKYLNSATGLSSEHPVVVTKFIRGAKEIEFDAVSQDGAIINYAISEHVENAGVHSGDATLVLPAQNLYVETIKRVRRISKKISKALHITGPFNIQFLCRENEIKVIECNLRASRSFPFVSKTFNINFISLATRAMIGQRVRRVEFKTMDIDYVCVKAPMFSFSRLQGADPILRVEMASTGEVACFGDSKHEAFIKSLISAKFKYPENRSVLLSIGPLEAKVDFGKKCVDYLIKAGFSIYATEGTHLYLEQRAIHATKLHKPSSKERPQVLDFIAQKKFDLAIVIPDKLTNAKSDGYRIRRQCVDYEIPLITNLQLARLLTQTLSVDQKDLFKIKSWKEYLNSTDSRLGSVLI